MKICAACSQTLPKEKFSKKQWQAKQHRRCKECIAENREANLEAPPPPPLCANSECVPWWTDKELFKQPPPRDECPICMLPLPVDILERQGTNRCGKLLCNGCIYTIEREDNRGLCPFCRTPNATSDREATERLKKRASEANDADAIFIRGYEYYNGERGFTQNYNKANKLFLRAGKLGCAEGYSKIGYAYRNGQGVERDENKAKYYYELAAMGGCVNARQNLGLWEDEAGNVDRAMKHLMISAGAGWDNSVKKIQQFFLEGHATKDDFEKALRAHKGAKDEMKSAQRDAAAAFYGLNH